MVSIKLKGREIPLIYTVFEMKQIQEDVGPLGDLQYILFGRSREDENSTSGYGSPGHLNAIAQLIRIMGNAGLEEAGQDPDLTVKWIMRSMKPAQLAEAMTACMEAMNEGMSSEIPEKEDDGEPVDVVLEEMNKKKERDG